MNRSQYHNQRGAQSARQSHNPKPFGPKSGDLVRQSHSANMVQTVAQRVADDIVAGLASLGHEACIVRAGSTDNRLVVEIQAKSLERHTREVCDVVRQAIERGRDRIDRKVGHIVAINGQASWTLSPGAY